LPVRRCGEDDVAAIFAVINDGAAAYRGAIPADRWHEPYMPEHELATEIAAGVRFSGVEVAGALVGVMGLQPVKDVTLIRHAYVRTDHQRRGIGTRMLEVLRAEATTPLLIGTWADATWAIRFYEKNGFRLVTAAEKDRLLAIYWSVPRRQAAASVVLADAAWWARRAR
jgi:GNAT superfamily N-acetyltransferase